MKNIFRVEKINIINDNLEVTETKTRIKLFNITVFGNYQKNKNTFKTHLKPF